MRDAPRRVCPRHVAVAAATAGLISATVCLPAVWLPTAAYAAQAGRTSGTSVADYVPRLDSAAPQVPAAWLPAPQTSHPVQPLGPLHTADLLVISPRTLPASVLTSIARMPGVDAVNLVDAASINVNGSYVATLGVNPSTFREFAAGPTAKSTVLWQNVADGGIVVSYLMGQQEKLPLGGTVKAVGAHTEQLKVGGYGTVGIAGVDAVVSESVARSLGMPPGNAIVISAPTARLTTLMRQVTLVLPKDASVAPLVAQAPQAGLPVSPGSAGAITITSASGPGLSAAQTSAFLAAALSRVGMPYVWGGDGPRVFDCSGLVQWSMRQAGIVMPRVAASQAQTGPLIPIADLQPGDLLFYHTDPTAPLYISHVAIYIGRGLMLQAPQPGENVQVVPAFFGAGFAGAVRVYPRLAAEVAANIAG